MGYTKDLIDITKVPENSCIHELIERLNTPTSYTCKDPEGTIMVYESLCSHDDGFLCEHRLQYIVDFLTKQIHK